MVPWSARKRQQCLPKVANELNSKLPAFTWEANPFVRDWSVPSLIRKRKTLYLAGKCKDSTDLCLYLQQASADWAAFRVINTKESIWYYDWGTGALDLTVELFTQDAKSLGTLLEFGEHINDTLKHGKGLQFFRDWDHSARIMTECMVDNNSGGKSTCYQNGLILSGKTDAYGINLILHSVEGSKLEFSKSELEPILGAFAGRTISDPDFVNLPGLFAVGEGYNGQFAVFDSDHRCAAQTKNRVCWLWRLVALYWANLSVLSEALSDRTLACLTANESQVRQSLIRLRREHLALKLFINESSPTNLCDDGLDLRVYDGIWKAWQSEKLVGEVNEQLSFLQVHFSETVDLMSAESQAKVNWILFVLNILTFSTVIATLITTYDISDKVLRPDFRLLLIGIGTTLFALLSLVFLVKNRILRFCKREGCSSIS